jgi:uridine kinase
MYLIGITGISCSGKTTLSRKVQQSLGEDQCLLISMDDFYKDLTPEQQKQMRLDHSVINFDTPESIDFALLKKTLNDLKSPTSDEIRLPKFDTAKCAITSWTTIPSNKYKFVIVEGLFVLNDPELVDYFDLKVWVETSDYVCALRRFMKFSQVLKGYTHEYIYSQCVKHVIPGQERFIKPMKRVCDFFVNGEIDDRNCVNMVVNYILKPV